MKKMIENQKKEIERAIVGMREYHISSDFRELQVDTRKIFQMSTAQREKLVKCFFTAKFKTCYALDSQKLKNAAESFDDETEFVHDSSASDGSKEHNDNPLLQLSSLPQYVAEKVWSESQQLESSTNSVCTSPGCTDGTVWLVQSNNSTCHWPYFVECKKNGQLVCEQSCMLFHSCNVCAHIVAVAMYKHCLDSLLDMIGKKQKGVSVTKMSEVGLTKKRGKNLVLRGKPH